jgi:hypothetical protein
MGAGPRPVHHSTQSVRVWPKGMYHVGALRLEF